jgi:glycosyltransferase involved in cell wall biosynthesis
MRHLVETLAALANAGGGLLVLGVDARIDPSGDPIQRVVGVGSPEPIAARLIDASTMADLDVDVTPYHLAGKTLLVADVRRAEHPQTHDPSPRDSHTPTRVLAVATEWLSRHGGLSTFNRELCTALSATGCDVRCLVPAADDADRASAREAHVELVVAAATPGADPRARLMRRPPLGDFVPHVVLGHGRITGPAALSLCEDAFPGALRVHFVHTVAEEIEWFKNRAVGAVSTISGDRDWTEKQLARTASLVVGVGPLLRRKASTMLRGIPGAPDVMGILPGLKVRRRPDGVPDDRQVLVLGRTEDRHLKGLDLAARALGMLDFGPIDEGRPPTLVVRGSPPEEAVLLRQDLVELADHRVDVLVRDYTADNELIDADLARASLLLLPSRHEGFGLVALEAIAAGLPVLVSDTSGIAEHLRSEGHARFVVPTRGRADAAAAAWSRAIDRTLFDLDAAFARAIDLRDALVIGMTWEQAADDLLTALQAVSATQRRATSP